MPQGKGLLDGGEAGVAYGVHLILGKPQSLGAEGLGSNSPVPVLHCPLFQPKPQHPFSYCGRCHFPSA